MNTMSAAQAAQQHNRDTDGRYTTHRHGETDLGLDGDQATPQLWLTVLQDGAVVSTSSFPSELLRDRALVRLAQDYRLDVAEATGQEPASAEIGDRTEAMAFLAAAGEPNGVSVQLTAPE